MAEFIPLSGPSGEAWNEPEGSVSTGPSAGTSGEAPVGAYGRQDPMTDRESGAGYPRRESPSASVDNPNSPGMPRQNDGSKSGTNAALTEGFGRKSGGGGEADGLGRPDKPGEGGESHRSKADRESADGPRSAADKEHGGDKPGSKPGSGAGPSDGSEDDGDKEKKAGKSAMKMKAVASAASNVGKAVGVAAKVQAITNLLSTMVNFIGAIGSAIATGVVAVITFIASVILPQVTQTPVAAVEPYVKDCIVYVDMGAVGDYNSPIDTTAIRMRFKRQIWSTLYYYGYRPEQIFGVIGNWTRESNLDPTSVENIFDEPYSIGPRKRFATTYDFVAKQADPKYAAQYPRIERLGVGIGAWTNGSNRKLMEYAQLVGRGRDEYNEEVSAHWYDLSVQLAFALDNSSVGCPNAGWFREWGNIGTKKSFPVTREDESSWEWHGDGPVHVYYAATDSTTVVDTDITPIGDGVHDEYYDGFVPDDNGVLTSVTCRDKAYERAYNECAKRDRAGEYTHRTLDGIVWSQSEYLKDFSAIYRFALYEEITKYYCQQFFYTWEGGGAILDDSYHLRRGWAMDLFHQWYGKMDETTIDGVNESWDTYEPNLSNFNPDFFKVEEGYASSIHAILDATEDANDALIKIYDLDEDMVNCRRVTLAESNKTMAEAACMIAWPTNLASRGNDGTPVYKYVHDKVMPGDTLYQSCDRTVCTAVRWSGLDDDFPIGSTLAIIQYLSSSPRWTELAWGGDKEQLQPGDVLIRKESMADGDTNESDPSDEHHVVMYVGEFTADSVGRQRAKVLPAAEPLEGSCIVHGSFGGRSPAIDVWYDGLSQYHAYRCTYPMDPGMSKYAGYTYTPAGANS